MQTFPSIGAWCDTNLGHGRVQNGPRMDHGKKQWQVRLVKNHAMYGNDIWMNEETINPLNDNE